MIHLLLILAVCFVQDVPLKPSDEFDIKLDYNFRSRPTADRNTVVLDGRPNVSRHTSDGVLPYLILHITPLKLAEEKMRVRIGTLVDDRVTQKKVEVNNEFIIDLGFTDDMKDRVTASHYILTFLDADKAPVDKIVINIAEDGSFFVNGEKRGKF
jgi:hypothetical protein